MRKTFYTVKANGIGWVGPQTLWYDNLEEARESSRMAYHDRVVTRSLTDPEKIKEAEWRVACAKGWC